MSSTPNPTVFQSETPLSARHGQTNSGLYGQMHLPVYLTEHAEQAYEKDLLKTGFYFLLV